ncbi:squalene/phytoene synthase family protein [Hydromonas duriensis]|uniref:Farnesyl-diphosphate farnesyltransferase n=1 Tax=Hydromonas duriensis TaxID=1527608 RepID=A0A4R6Y5M3_9BURK|nr:squalene/phytoene synthase family protein [Hydromonas duriensis]TDR30767.1 farnesyl-diphosphate farnesyltransferase [Hydromonas duriensis]
MSHFIEQLNAPQPASSLFFALRSAPRKQQVPLRALYTLHKKWREASEYVDQHQAVTTLNWWHHELEKTLAGEINHPALIELKPFFSAEDKSPTQFFKQLQGLLHGHMHWHHLTRVDTLAQLEPTIDAIAGSFSQAWLGLTYGSDSLELNNYAQAAGRVIWWVDHTRHIGHELTPSRLWLPMVWLKELNLPAHLLLKKDAPIAERSFHGADLMKRLLQQGRSSLSEYEQAYRSLNREQQKTVHSLHVLVELRKRLLDEINAHPAEVWEGVVSLSPLQKWWATARL